MSAPQVPTFRGASCDRGQRLTGIRAGTKDADKAERPSRVKLSYCDGSMTLSSGRHTGTACPVFSAFITTSVLNFFRLGLPRNSRRVRSS